MNNINNNNIIFMQLTFDDFIKIYQNELIPQTSKLANIIKIIDDKPYINIEQKQNINTHIKKGISTRIKKQK